MLDQAPLPTIALAADHGGFLLKQAIAAHLRAAGYTVTDFGCHSADRVDYPDYAHQVCDAVTSGAATYGVLVCGTGIGMSIAANRFPGIRCALIHDITGARLTRMHNDANVIAFGARLIGEEVALDALRVFLATPYEGGRHDRRIAKLNASASAPAGEHNQTSIGAT